MLGRKTVWKHSLALIGLVGLVGLWTVACSQPTPEERVAQIRSKYEASLNGFVVEQEPITPAEGEMAGDLAGEMVDSDREESEPIEAEAAPPAEGETTEEGGEMAADSGDGPEEPVELHQNVLLDIVIRHDSAEKLDGVTVDITMADGQRELEIWRVWFDTTGLEKGPGIQYTHTLEDVDYQPGYGFSAEIRHPVPPEERSLYEEFPAAS